MMKKYKEFKISSIPFNADILSGVLWELNITGINEEDNLLRIFAEADSDVNRKLISDLLSKLKSQNIIESFDIIDEIHEYKNWNKEWEKNLNIIKVSDKFVIRPSTKEYTPQDSEIVLIIDPKMSFGTGEHETTRLVLGMLGKHFKNRKFALDAGTGTGALAIAAAKLGAEKVIAFDNDEWCFLNGNENIKLNNVDDRVEVRLGIIDDIKEDNFDLALANINKNILAGMAEQLAAKLKKEGILILSGLLNTDESDIRSTYESAGFSVFDKSAENEWICLAMKKTL